MCGNMENGIRLRCGRASWGAADGEEREGGGPLARSFGYFEGFLALSASLARKMDR